MRLEIDGIEIERRLRAAFPNSGTVYMIGGYVRDGLWNRFHGTNYSSKDLDYVIIGQSTETVIERLNNIGRVDLVGASFGVFKVTVDGVTADVAFGRREKSTGQGHKDFEVSFGPEVSLRDDQFRRDFYFNMVSRDIVTNEIEAPQKALDDIRDRVISMSSPQSFLDDPLRMLRMGQFAARFEARPDAETFEAAKKNAHLCATAAPERLQEEFRKLLTKADRPSIGLNLFRDTGILRHVLPELDRCVGVTQNIFHAYDVYRHCTEAMDAAPKIYLVRLASLAHDLGKPQAKSAPGHEGPNGPTFHRHEHYGSEIAEDWLRRWKYPNATIQAVSHLVEQHMYVADPDLSDSALRRFIRRVGPDNLEALFAVRHADIDGCGVPKYQRHEKNLEFENRVRLEVERKPALTFKDLDIKGNEIVDILVERGARPVGYRGDRAVSETLSHLLNLVLDDTSVNSRERLIEHASRFADNLSRAGIDASRGRTGIELGF